jgi:hypothetical protein
MSRFVALLLSLTFIAPRLATAQASTTPAADSAWTYVYLLAGDTVAFEAVQMDSAALNGAYLVPGQMRINWSHALRDGMPAELTLGFFPANAPPLLPPLRQIEYTPYGDSVVITISEADESRREAVGAAAGAVPLLGRSLLHAILVASVAERQQRRSFPVFLTSSARSFTAEVRTSGDDITLLVDGLSMVSQWRNGAPQEITVASQGLRVVRLP